jgi:hypothetical protein
MKKREPIPSGKCDLCGRELFCDHGGRKFRRIDPREVGFPKMRKGRLPFKPPQEELLDAAKADPAIRPAFIQVLLTARRQILAREPNIPDRHLVTAIRVSHQFRSHSEKWSELHERLLRLLLGKHLWGGPPLSARDASCCQTVVAEMARCTGMDSSPFQKDLQEVKPYWAAHHQQEPGRGAGRQLAETNQRVIAAVHFLKVCGEKQAEETVSAELSNLELSDMMPDSIRRLVARHKATTLAQWYKRPLDDLLDVWLLALYSYLSPIVAASNKANLKSRDRIGKELKGRD